MLIKLTKFIYFTNFNYKYSSKDPIISIDLGTINSRVAILEDDNSKIIENC